MKNVIYTNAYRKFSMRAIVRTLKLIVNARPHIHQINAHEYHTK